MENKSDFNFWLLAGICFVVSGLVGDKLGLSALGLAFICMGFSKGKDNPEGNKKDEKIN